MIMHVHLPGNMKKHAIFIAAMLFLNICVASAQIRSNRDLLGKWEGKDMQLEFFADSKVVMIVPGGKLPVATYNADFMKHPVAVSITLTDNGQKMVYKGELEFMDNETIKLKYFGDEEGKDAFARGRTVTLKRKK